MATGSVFSDTLQSITTTKLSELSRKRATFEARHTEAINSLQAQSDPLARLTTLLASVKHCFNIDTKTNSAARRNRPNSEERQPEEDLVRLERFLEQAKFDPSLTDRMLHKWEETLIHHLDVQLRRYEYATLYGQLVTEWLSPDKRQDATPTATAPSTDAEIGDGFEELPDKKRLEAREQFESAVFASADVDESAIKQYLGGLFSNEETYYTYLPQKRQLTSEYMVALPLFDQPSTSCRIRCPIRQSFFSWSSLGSRRLGWTSSARTWRRRCVS
jgi:hypothetical protein